MDKSIVKNILSGEDGSNPVFVVNDSVMKFVAREESQIRFTSGIRIENRALEACLRKKHLMCVFFQKVLEEPTKHTLVLMDNYDNITGYQVLEQEKAELKKRSDVFWLTEDFAVFPDAPQKSESKFIFLPQEYGALSDVKDVSNAIVFYPSMTTDRMLKRWYGIEEKEGMGSAIIAYDDASQMNPTNSAVYIPCIPSYAHGTLRGTREIAF